MKKILVMVCFLVIVGLITVGIVFYARGYRPNLKNGSVDPTGIVSVRSEPDGAKVFVDGAEKGTTDLDLSSLKPGQYTILITKDGFSQWEEKVEIKKEKVSVIFAILFPKAPSLRALTFTGVEKPIYSPKSRKLIFSVAAPQEKAGIWSLNLSTSPLPSFFTKDLTRLVADTEGVPFSKKSYDFSPDGNQILIHNGIDNSYYLASTSAENQTPTEVTLDLEKLQSDWEKKVSSDLQKDLTDLGKEAQNFSTNLTAVQISPEKEKFFGKKSDGSVVLFDSNPGVAPTKISITITLPKALSYHWYPDGDYIVLVRKNSISIFNIDNQREVTLFTEKFDLSFAAVWPDGSKIVILTSLNSASSKLPNLYAIELR